MPFESFNKIPRLNRDMVITEKIDGTNAQVLIVPTFEVPEGDDTPFVAQVGDMLLAAGSRNRYVTPEKDNYGFARWVVDNQLALAELGPGLHYGEWWGSGIQRRYGLGEKRFSLFNVGRWSADNVPSCCHVVPTMYIGPFNTEEANNQLMILAEHGSLAAPGFMRPEGIIVYHTAANSYFKATIEGDAVPKSLQ